MSRDFATLLLLTLVGCDTGSLDVLVDLDDPSILVDVGGGVAGADFGYAVSADGVVVATHCRSLCDFKVGDTLHVLSPLQEQELGYALNEARAWEVVGERDYGIPCCDHFAYTLTFVNGGAKGVVRGSPPSFPEPYRDLVVLLEGLRQGVAPVVVLEGPLVEGYPADMVEIRGAVVDPPYLVVDARYGGGCARHDLDVVALPGWRESWPVQVDLDLAHEDHDDPCDALVTRTVRFDLRPLREAYGDRYGPAAATLELHLGPASGGARRVLRWSF